MAGVAVAREARRITRNSEGLLTVSTTTHKDGDLNTGRITVDTSGNGTTAATVEFTYNHDNKRSVVSETALTARDGDNAIYYYIQPTSGTAIRSGTGTLTVEAHRITGGVDAILSSGTIRLYDPSNNELTVANGYIAGSDGFTGILNSGNISGSIVITLKNGPGGTPLDTITLVDVTDGIDGDPGTPGEDAVFGSIEPSGPLASVKAKNTGIWTPSSSITDLDCTFYLAGVAVAREARRLTRNSEGLLTVSTTTHKNGNLNTGRISVDTLGNGTTTVTVEFTYNI